MQPANRKALIALPIIVLIGALIALAGSHQGSTLGGVPVFAIAVGAAFIVQWIAFIPAFAQQSEKFFDLTGSLTYIAITVLIVSVTPGVDARSFALALMVLLWAGRLGTFLFRRVHRAGKDDRFDAIKPLFFRFLNVWTMQGLWVTFTAAAAWVSITSARRVEFDVFAAVGLLVWVVGFAFEVTADQQKSRFKADPSNRGTFISTGLWSKSRHPNYFGEILLWLGVAIVAMPTLQGWQWVVMISPVFVALLLIKVSGIPLLEAKADATWGGRADYEQYKASTPVLIPKF